MWMLDRYAFRAGAVSDISLWPCSLFAGFKMRHFLKRDALLLCIGVYKILTFCFWSDRSALA